MRRPGARAGASKAGWFSSSGSKIQLDLSALDFGGLCAMYLKANRLQVEHCAFFKRESILQLRENTIAVQL
jgi:hypothetical protein